MNLNTFFQLLWQDYLQLTPQAEKIQALFTHGGVVAHIDHVALRTFNRSPVHLEHLERHLLVLGYRRLAPCQFTEKKLNAWSYVHADPQVPRVFLSELMVEQLSPTAQTIIDRLCAHSAAHLADSIDVFWAGRLWPMPSWNDYQTLLAESEYAAWVAAIGLRPDHFTLAVDRLEPPLSMVQVIDTVERAGFQINSVGGKIKGSPAQWLEQAATVADRVPVMFAEGDVHDIPTGYCEFARRYPQADGSLYQGFVTASADMMFASTNMSMAGAGAGS